jgi:hypothetical protein
MAGLTIENPVTLAQALASNNIIAGDTLLLRAGTYTGDWLIGRSINGTALAPVIIKPYNGEAVTIDGTLSITGDYINLYDLDFTDSRTNRQTITAGVYAIGLGFGMYGCFIHDQHASGVSWYGYGAGAVSENVIYNNGYLSVEGFGHGHGIYTHNGIAGAHEISRNLFSRSVGSYTIHLYSGGPNYLRDYTVADNLIYGAVQAGGGYGLVDFIYQDNVMYQEWVQLGAYIYDQSYRHTNGLIDSNLFIEQNTYSINLNCNLSWQDLTESDNTVWLRSGYTWPRETGYTSAAAPATWSKWVAFTKSERWAGYIALFDRDSAGSVSVDFTGKLAPGVYTVRNYQNMSESAELDLSSSLVADVPTSGWTMAAPVGIVGNVSGQSPRVASWPHFGALVVETE